MFTRTKKIEYSVPGASNYIDSEEVYFLEKGDKLQECVNEVLLSELNSYSLSAILEGIGVSAIFDIDGHPEEFSFFSDDEFENEKDVEKNLEKLVYEASQSPCSGSGGGPVVEGYAE